jgi:hypothetical protein
MVRSKPGTIKYYQIEMETVAAAPGSAGEPNRVWCLETDGGGEPDEHRHVVALEASRADERRQRRTTVQVIAAIRDGELFVVGDGGRGQAAVLEPSVCPRCHRATLVTHPASALDAIAACS